MRPPDLPPHTRGRNGRARLRRNDGDGAMTVPCARSIGSIRSRQIQRSFAMLFHFLNTIESILPDFDKTTQTHIWTIRATSSVTSSTARKGSIHTAPPSLHRCSEQSSIGRYRRKHYSAFNHRLLGIAPGRQMFKNRL